MSNPKLKCSHNPDKDCDLQFVSKEETSSLKYDYTETTAFYYYKCNECGKMFDERTSTTGIRPLALRHYEKAVKLANN